MNDPWAAYQAAKFADNRHERAERRRLRRRGLVITAKMSERASDVLAFDWTGKTNIKNYRLTVPKAERHGFKGFYTYRRAWPKVRAAINQLDALWRLSGGVAYLHTWTASPSYAPTDAHREALWRKYVDNVRKVWPHMAYLWCTEWHTGTGTACGLKHFHMVTVHGAEVDFRKEVQRLSIRYCGSRNGLDIERVDKTVGYGAKYIAKEARNPEPNRSMTRLWACGGLLRSYRCANDHDSALEFIAMAPRSGLRAGGVYLCPASVAERLASEVLRKTRGNE